MKDLFSKIAWLAIVAAAAVLAWTMVRDGAAGIGTVFFAGTLLVAWVYSSRRTFAARYLLPGLATFALFVLLPLLYTLYIAFTNFSGSHLFDQARVQEWFMRDFWTPDAARHPFTLHPEADGRYRIAIPSDTGGFLVSRPFLPADTADPASPPIALEPADALPADPALDLRGIVDARPWFNRARFAPPGDAPWPLRPVSLRALGTREPLWRLADGGVLVNQHDGRFLVPDAALGSYVDQDTGETVGPGWRVRVGFANFRQILGNPKIRSPFFRIFAWNVSFALLTVLITFAIGVLLASLLQWPALRGRGIYRTLLILPYAIPAFIPILVFRGLFNEGYGEINLLLKHLFGIAPAWFTNPWLARAMILIVNTWLGYPYMMIISAGMLQAVPTDLYEASSIDGATPWQNFSRITLPQILPPLLPLLVASFAFNFNNFTLIYLLTGGRPAIPGSATIAGSTDLLVSYTYRVAFRDSSAQMGFASAVATLLFVIVGVLAWLQLRLARKPNPGK
jgi:maltose/maltodextrin transport system permease protein